MIHVCLEMGNRRPAFNAARNKRRMMAHLFGFRRYIFVKVFCRVGKSRKNKDFPVARVNGSRFLFLNDSNQLIQFIIVFRSNIFHHADEQESVSKSALMSRCHEI